MAAKARAVELLALVGIGTGLLLTFIVYAALRSMARRRLAAHHD